MSNNITSLVSSLLVIGGLTVIAVFFNLDVEPSVVSPLESKMEKVNEGVISNGAKNVSVSISDIEIPEVLPEPPPEPIEVEPIDFAEVVVQEERELIEVGAEASIIKICGWSCDGRCGLRVLNPSFHEYVAPEIEPVFEALVFPNPTIDRLTLRLTVSEEIEPMIQLYSSNGTFLRTINYTPILEGENDIPVNIIDLPKGMYFLVLYSQEIKETIRFIKQ